MCEMLVRIEDKATDPDPDKDRHISKKGHVIDVRHDGWDWSEAERTNPAWRIGRVPGAPPEDYTKFIMAAVQVGPLATVQVARKAFYLDVDQLAAPVSWRSGEIRTFTLTQIDDATIATVVPSPITVIG